MRLKGVMAVLISALLVWTAAPVAYAYRALPVVLEFSAGEGSELLSEAEVISLFRQAFPELCQGADLVGELQDRGSNDQPTWWISQQGQEYPGSDNNDQKLISGTVDARTGEILGLVCDPELDFYQGKRVALTRSQALKIASAFVNQKDAGKVPQLILDKEWSAPPLAGESYRPYYSFLWNRSRGGIPVEGNSLMVGVDAYSGMVTRYQSIWHDMEFPPESPVLPAEPVMEQMLNNPGLFMEYLRHAPNGVTPGAAVKPVYQLNTTARYVDAVSGDWLDEEGRVIQPEESRIYEGNFQMADPGLTLTNQSGPESNLSYAEAQQIAAAFFKAQGIDRRDYRGSFTDRDLSAHQDPTWQFNLRGEQTDISVEIAASSGQIVRLAIYGDDPPEEGLALLTEQQARELAMSTIRQYAPELSGQLVENHNWKVEGAPEHHQHFHFTRLVNGLPVHNDDITVVVNTASGKIIEYQAELCPVEYHPGESLLTREQASLTLQKLFPLRLTYAITDRNNDQARTARLVYSLPSFQRVDAVTGQALDLQQPPPAAGGFSVPELSLLAENGLFPGKPGQEQLPVTRRQALKAVVMSTNPRRIWSHADEIQLSLTDIAATDPDHINFKLAVKRGIIPNRGRFDPDSHISREEISTWLVKAIGYDDIARLTVPIVLPFADADRIKAGYRNYVGLTCGLGLLGADDQGCFSPGDPITWEELATVASKLAATR